MIHSCYLRVPALKSAFKVSSSICHDHRDMVRKSRTMKLLCAHTDSTICCEFDFNQLQSALASLQ